MARYIDADELLKKIYPMGIGDGMYVINAKAVKFAIDNTPTADVVPSADVEQLKRNLEQCENGYRQEMHLLQCKLTNANSEVERLEKENEKLTINMNAYGLAAKRLAEEKAEVAREIFEEIGKSVALKMPAKITLVFKRDLDYSYGVIDGKREALFEVLVLLAELKKKYMED